MNPRKTWLLVALALVVFGFIVLYEWPRDAKLQTAGGRSQLLPDFDPAAVTSVVVSRTNQIIRAERTNDAWRLVLPITAPAHTTKIEHLLTVFTQLDRHAHISDQELQAQKQSLAAFGLDPPRASISAQFPASMVELIVGSLTPVGNRVYVKLVNTDGVFFTDGAFLDRLPRTADDWRDPTFLPLKSLTFDRLEVRARNGGFVVQIDPSTQLWKLVSPMKARADNRKLSLLINQLKEWQIKRFVAANPKLDLESFGLLPQPEATLVFGQGTNDLLLIPFGKSPAADEACVYAQAPPPQAQIVIVPREPLDKMRGPLTNLLERRLISEPLNEVGLIEAETYQKFSLQRQNDGSWRMPGATNMPIDTELVQSFLHQLGSLEIVDFEKDVVTDFSAYGLTHPVRRYTLRTGPLNTAGGVTNRLIAQLDLGTNQTDKVFAHLANEDSVYVASADACKRLPTEALQLRDRHIWTFDATNVTQLILTAGNQSRTFTRNARGQLTEPPATAAVESVLETELEEALHRLGELRAEAWIGRGDEWLSALGFPAMAHSLALTVKKGGETQSLTLAFGPQAPAPSKNMLASTVVDGQRLIFEMRIPLFDLLRDIFPRAPGVPH